MIEPEVNFTTSQLETNCQKAIWGLKDYLETPKERILREHQMDVMESLHDDFKKGETAGYINLPTAAGKGHLIPYLAQTLGLKTVVLSPTKIILEKTSANTEQLTPDAEIVNYYSTEKSLTGQILNTTYQSFLQLLNRGQINPEEFGLVIADESDLGLGKERHTIYRPLSNALMIGLTATPYFNSLEWLIQRGKVNQEERWTKLFSHCFHEMTLEEAMEREIISNLDVYLLETNVSVGNVEILQGDYNTRQLERFINTQARNYLAVAAIAGLDKVPPSIKFSEKQLEQLEEIHQLIQGKRTVVFCPSIEMAENFAQTLRQAGITAESIHSKVADDLRRERLQKHKSGEIQALTGVDALGRGWDSPETEVGIYPIPTFSGRKAVQQVGRILRLSPDSGKKRAIAIQLVDTFTERRYQPVLIPNIFDPYYILRGSQIGREVHKTQSPSLKDKPVVTFSGMNIETVIKEAQSRDLLQNRLKRASIEEINQTLQDEILKIQQEQPAAQPLQIYEALAEKLPYFIPRVTQQVALQALANIDSNIAKMGKNMLVFLNMATILTAIEPFFSKQEEDNNEIVQSALTRVIHDLSRLNPNVDVVQQIYHSAQVGAAGLIAQKKNVPVRWALERREEELINLLQQTLDSLTHIPDKDELKLLSQQLAEQTKAGPLSLRQYLGYLLLLDQRLPDHTKVQNGNLEDTAFLEMQRQLLKETLAEVLDSLTDRARLVLTFRFSLDGGGERTLEKTGIRFGVTGERIRGIEASALKRLRLPSRSELLEEYLDLEENFVPFRYPADENRFGQKGISAFIPKMELTTVSAKPTPFLQPEEIESEEGEFGVGPVPINLKTLSNPKYLENILRQLKWPARSITKIPVNAIIDSLSRARIRYNPKTNKIEPALSMIDLLSFTDSELLKLPVIGPKSLSIIHEAFQPLRDDLSQ